MFAALISNKKTTHEQKKISLSHGVPFHGFHYMENMRLLPMYVFPAGSLPRALSLPVRSAII